MVILWLFLCSENFNQLLYAASLLKCFCSSSIWPAARSHYLFIYNFFYNYTLNTVCLSWRAFVVMLSCVYSIYQWNFYVSKRKKLLNFSACLVICSISWVQVRGALETLVSALTPINHAKGSKDQVQPALMNSDLLSRESDSISLLLSLLVSHSSYV